LNVHQRPIPSYLPILIDDNTKDVDPRDSSTGHLFATTEKSLMALTGWEHFKHQTYIGVRGFGQTPAEAFEQCALAMIAIITDLSLIEERGSD